MLNGVRVGAERWVLRRMDGASERLGRLRGRPEHLLVGERGEREAFFYLREQGYTVVARRWKAGRLRGDVDLIGWDGDSLCFVEVKTRSERKAMDPAESAVDEDKRRMLRRMAEAYVRGFPEERRRAVAVRFDVVAVYLQGEGARGAARAEFELFRGAFQWY